MPYVCFIPRYSLGANGGKKVRFFWLSGKVGDSRQGHSTVLHDLLFSRSIKKLTTIVTKVGAGIVV